MRTAAALLVLAAGCGEGLPPPYLVADLRILGLRAEPPEGPAGTTIALDSLVVAPDDAAAIEQVWFACPALAGAAAATMPCAMEDAVLLGEGGSTSVTLPPGSPQLIVTTAAALSGAGGLDGCLSGFQASGTVPADCRVAVKRVNVLAEGAPANVNPTIDAPMIADERVLVTVADPDPDDLLILSWHVTAGELERYRTDADEDGLENAWTPPTEAGRVFVVVRDDQGGEAWGVGSRP